MDKTSILHKTFKFMGDNPNSAIAVAVAIAAFKGVFRPMFTMMDKNSDPDTKKYAAIREGLTELIAIPVYIAVPVLAEKLIVGKFLKNQKSEVIKKAAKTNVKFWGVLASTAIIPAVCNVLQPPIMNVYKMYQESKKQPLEDAKINTVQGTKPSFAGAKLPVKQNIGKINYGMRIGN